MNEELLTRLCECRLFAGCIRDEVEFILSRVEPVQRRYLRRELAVRQDERLDSIGLLLSGLISEAKIDSGGNSSLIYMIEPGKLFGVVTAATPSQISPLTLTCEEDATAVYLPYSQLVRGELIPPQLSLMITRNIAGILANESMRRMYKIELLCCRALRERILTYLRFMEQKKGGGTFEVPFDREQMAQYLNVNRSALSHELACMRGDGLIDFNRNSFTLLNRK